MLLEPMNVLYFCGVSSDKHVGVSKNRGTPKSSILIGFSGFAL